MNILQLIEKKKLGGAFSQEEIGQIVSSYSGGSLPDYQMAALLMAIYFKGMTEKETLDLTQAMVQSGDSLDLSDIKGVRVDKHSTGGVGDTTSLILGPILAACGLVVAKMSGRGLGHTGGTLDKLDAIPGFSSDLSEEAFMDQANAIGLVIGGQSASLTPADKKMYALRDATGTVNSMPLIASSIMSKKIAIKNDILVLDVKAGEGAFMENKEAAEELAQLLVKIGQGAGRKVAALVTSMDQPLGQAIGNSLEVIEAIECLKGRGPKDLYDLVLALAQKALVLAGEEDPDQAKKRVEEALEKGLALDKFRDMVIYQGGDPACIGDYALLPSCAYSLEVKAPRSAFIKRLPALEIGEIARDLGAGRLSLEDELDLGAGLVLEKKQGDFVEKGQGLCRLYANDEDKLQLAQARFLEVLEFSDEAPKNQDLILSIVE
ncbi:MAG: thymidine phosphorylase [Tissierellia bacterium]|nr:thymidine phosphorylase [Tissierellia bacterium]